MPINKSRDSDNAIFHRAVLPHLQAESLGTTPARASQYGVMDVHGHGYKPTFYNIIAPTPAKVFDCPDVVESDFHVSTTISSCNSFSPRI